MLLTWTGYRYVEETEEVQIDRFVSIVIGPRNILLEPVISQMSLKIMFSDP